VDLFIQLTHCIALPADKMERKKVGTVLCGWMKPVVKTQAFGQKKNAKQ